MSESTEVDGMTAAAIEFLTAKGFQIFRKPVVFAVHSIEDTESGILQASVELVGSSIGMVRMQAGDTLNVKGNFNIIRMSSDATAH